jgi:hypothetical protein
VLAERPTARPLARATGRAPMIGGATSEATLFRFTKSDEDIGTSATASVSYRSA